MAAKRPGRRKDMDQQFLPPGGYKNQLDGGYWPEQHTTIAAAVHWEPTIQRVMRALCRFEGLSISINAVATWKRSFWLWALFRLGHRPQGACSLAETSPKDQKSSLPIATSFLSMLLFQLGDGVANLA